MSVAVALVSQQRPRITPDQVKALLTSTAQRLPAADPRAQGNGMIDLKEARGTATPRAVQRHQRATGTGSLELARGSLRLYDGDVPLAGEVDIFGTAFGSPRWALTSAAGTSWAGGDWNGNRWSSDRWSGDRWATDLLTGNRWSGNRWTSDGWSGNRWSGNRWSGNRWSGAGWSGNRWSSGGWR